MLEQKIEKIVIDELQNALSSDGIVGVQSIGAWQTGVDGGLKAFEKGDAAGILAVKTYPRSYETPTIPYAAINVDVSLTMRADIGYDGATWLSAVDALSRKMQSWQDSYSGYAETFALSGEFRPSGFNLAGGDVGLDRDSCTWSYSQSFNLHGVVEG